MNPKAEEFFNAKGLQVFKLENIHGARYTTAQIEETMMEVYWDIQSGQNIRGIKVGGEIKNRLLAKVPQRDIQRKTLVVELLTQIRDEIRQVAESSTKKPPTRELNLNLVVIAVLVWLSLVTLGLFSIVWKGVF